MTHRSHPASLSAAVVRWQQQGASAPTTLPRDLTGWIPCKTQVRHVIARYGRIRDTAGKRSCQRGVTSIEYALIAALIAVVVTGSVTQVGTRLGSLYAMLAAEVACAASGTGC